MYDYLLTRLLCSVLKAINQRKEERKVGVGEGKGDEEVVLHYFTEKFTVGIGRSLGVKMAEE